MLLLFILYSNQWSNLCWTNLGPIIISISPINSGPWRIFPIYVQGMDISFQPEWNGPFHYGRNGPFHSGRNELLHSPPDGMDLFTSAGMEWPIRFWPEWNGWFHSSQNGMIPFIRTGVDLAISFRLASFVSYCHNNLCLIVITTSCQMPNKKDKIKQAGAALCQAQFNFS